MGPCFWSLVSIQVEDWPVKSCRNDNYTRVDFSGRIPTLFLAPVRFILLVEKSCRSDN